MDLSWTDEDISWAANLCARLASPDDGIATGGSPKSFADAEIARQLLPGLGRSLASPERAMLAMIEHGRALLDFPIVEMVVLPAQLLTANRVLESLENAVAEGAGELAVAWQEPDIGDNFAMRSEPLAGVWRLSGRKTIVVGGPRASRFVVAAREGEIAQIFLIEADNPGLSFSPYMMIDGRHAADLVLDSVGVTSANLIASGDAAEHLLARALDVATAANCAQAVGMMRFLLDATASFLKARQQFGQALSSFQVLQHRMVDMLLHAEMAEAATLRAMLSLDLEGDQRGLAVSAAKVTTGEAARFVGQSAIQLHGGQGMRDATVATRYFRRLTAFDLAFGNEQDHLARVSADGSASLASA